MNDAAICLLLVDGVIAFAIVEVVGLVGWRLLTGRGLAVADCCANIAAGLCLLGALHAVLSQSAWPLCASWLAAAGIAHAADLLRRVRAAAGRAPAQASKLATERAHGAARSFFPKP